MSETNGSNGTNGSGPHGPGDIGDKVAAALLELVVELGENRRLQMAQETRMIGLARVIGRGVPFGPETAEQVAGVIREAGDLAHERGSILYLKADRIGETGKG
jgi:hypothetical protein